MGRYLIALITSNDCCVGLCNGLKWIWDHFYKTSCILHYDRYSLMMYKSCCRNAFNHSPHLNVTENLSRKSVTATYIAKKWLFLCRRFYRLYVVCHYFAWCKRRPLNLKVQLVTLFVLAVCISQRCDKWIGPGQQRCISPTRCKFNHCYYIKTLERVLGGRVWRFTFT